MHGPLLSSWLLVASTAGRRSRPAARAGRRRPACPRRAAPGRRHQPPRNGTAAPEPRRARPTRRRPGPPPPGLRGRRRPGRRRGPAGRRRVAPRERPDPQAQGDAALGRPRHLRRRRTAGPSSAQRLTRCRCPGRATPPRDGERRPMRPPALPESRCRWSPRAIRPVRSRSLRRRTIALRSDRPSPTACPHRGTRPPAARPEPAGPGLDEADAAFRAKKYAEAGRIYGAWPHAQPVARRPPRALGLLPVVGGGPPDRRQAEDRGGVGEHRRRDRPDPRPGPDQLAGRVPPQPRCSSPLGAARLPKPGRRSSAPPPPTKPPLPGQTAGPPEPPPARARRRVTDVRPRSPTSAARHRGAAGSGRWRVRESTNFRVFHADPNLAEQVVRSPSRSAATRPSGGRAALPAAPWQPRCEIYLYPTASSTPR